MSLAVLIGLLKIGPFPSTKFTSMPKASGTVKISENKIAASNS